MIEVDIDASDVPADYILSILSQCSTFPEVLIFFLKGHLTANYLLQRQYLATIDTYFMISCTDGHTIPTQEARSLLLAAGLDDARPVRDVMKQGP